MTSSAQATAVRLLDQIPLPNLPGNLNNLEVIKTNKTTYWNFSTRVDWNPSERWKWDFMFQDLPPVKGHSVQMEGMGLEVE